MAKIQTKGSKFSNFIARSRLLAIMPIILFAAVGAYIVIRSQAATSCAPYCHPSLKTGRTDFLQGPDWYSQDLNGNNNQGRSYGSGPNDDEYGSLTSHLVVLAFSDWRLVDMVPNYKVGTIVELKVWLLGSSINTGGIDDISAPRAIQFGSIEKLTHFGAGDVYRDPSMIEVMGSDFENQCFKVPTDPARIQGNQYFIGTFKIKILHEVARTIPGDSNSPSRTWALNIPHYVTMGSECSSDTQKFRNIVVPAECWYQVSVTCSPIDAPGDGPGAGPGPDGPGSATNPSLGPGSGGGGSSAKTQANNQTTIPSSSSQGDGKQPALEASPFFDGKQYEPGSDPDILGVNTTFSVAGHNLKYGWVYVIGALILIGGSAYYVYKKQPMLVQNLKRRLR